MFFLKHLPFHPFCCPISLFLVYFTFLIFSPHFMAMRFRHLVIPFDPLLCLNLFFYLDPPLFSRPTCISLTPPHFTQPNHFLAELTLTVCSLLVVDKHSCCNVSHPHLYLCPSLIDPCSKSAKCLTHHPTPLVTPSSFFLFFFLFYYSRASSTSFFKVSFRQSSPLSTLVLCANSSPLVIPPALYPYPFSFSS